MRYKCTNENCNCTASELNYIRDGKKCFECGSDLVAMPSQNKQQKDMQWKVDNLTYSLTKGELTMAQCTDKILQLFQSYAAAERIAELEKIKSDAKKFGLWVDSTVTDIETEADDRIAELQERITQ